MSGEPDQYGVIGHPVSHSWSPFIHGLFARQTGQSMSYRLYDAPPGRFRSCALEFFAGGGLGLNVTVPHKAAAAELANELTPRAERAGAVNTLALQGDHRLLGDNTDGAGLVRDLRSNLGIELIASRLLLLGAGGAARGVLAPLLALEPAEIVIANRTAARARELAQRFASLGPVTGCGFGDIPVRPFDLVINATASSLQGGTPDVPPRILGRETVCYDMAYGRAETPFELWAREHGCMRTHQGWGMLVEQAAESFYLWRGMRPATAPVLAALRSRAAHS
ncbi:MAG: shikimate dehydrogenase [Gammaproteobacteria bacterium]|nr:shikimate dehydrogenase [Gammaproteobacteria bacterium]